MTKSILAIVLSAGLALSGTTASALQPSQPSASSDEGIPAGVLIMLAIGAYMVLSGNGGTGRAKTQTQAPTGTGTGTIVQSF